MRPYPIMDDKEKKEKLNEDKAMEKMKNKSNLPYSICIYIFAPECLHGIIISANFNFNLCLK